MVADPRRAALRRVLMTNIQPRVRAEIHGLLDALGIPKAFDDPTLSKARYIESRINSLGDGALPAVLERLLSQHGSALSAVDRFEVEELVWAKKPGPIVNKRARYALARALEGVPLFRKPRPFLDAIARFWERTDALQGLLAASLRDQVERHVVQNPGDWTTEQLFEELDAYSVSDRRFTLFLEALVSHDVRPDTANQREFTGVVNRALSGEGVELREVGEEGGFPVFRLAAIGKGVGPAKNLIFASDMKPDLRFTDAVSNDIEIVTHADKVLVYDRALLAHGLLWRELQGWWEGLHGEDSESAKKALYRRLLACLPSNSPPQQILFETFFRHFGSRVPELPALLPEVWLHWDPKTARERGPEALTRYRMDFLMLLPNETRIVLEVDGRHHYADHAGRADPGRYGEMVSADRDLRLAGYDVYRFGAAELDRERGPALAATFFDQLFKRYGVLS